MLLDIFKGNFDRINRTVAKGVLLTVEAMMKCANSNTSAIVRELCLINDNDFKTNDMWLYRLLGNKNFQIDDHFWRCYIKSVFQMLLEQEEIQKDHEVFINIDLTSDRDDFLILCASVALGGNAIPVYFSMRNAPKRKNQYNHEKMEAAFIKALRHIFSDRYRYILVADREFSNERFIQLCLENGFDVLIRVEPNTAIAHGCKQGIAEDILMHDGAYACHAKILRKDCHMIRHSKDNEVWYFLTNMSIKNGLDGAEIYAQRFRIEKLFQSLKSSGFDLEKSKIKKYDRFKRMLFLSCFAHSMLVLLGKFVHEKIPDMKKSLPICTSLFIVSSSLESWLWSTPQSEPRQH